MQNKQNRQKRKEAGVQISDQLIVERKRDPAVCSICQDRYEGYSHNAQPVNDGRCCSVCNDTVVIPARIRQMSSGR